MPNIDTERVAVLEEQIEKRSKELEASIQERLQFENKAATAEGVLKRLRMEVFNAKEDRKYGPLWTHPTRCILF